MEINENKVLVAMSGGVDSSVAAALLIDSGYEVEGITFIPYHANAYDTKFSDDSYIEDAKNICNTLKIIHHTVDFSSDFKNEIIDYFIRDYLNGRTPNPCTRCNPIIKFGKLFEKADELGAKYIATGHYSIINQGLNSGRYYITKGKDSTKDQSYMLWGLGQEQLSRIIFPLGNHTKDQTKEIANSLNFNVVNKPESQEVCFIPDDDYRRYLLDNSNVIKEIGKGDIVMDGKVLGRHDGYPFYTIGQRKGLGISYSEPLYVKNIDSENNIVEVTTNNNLFEKTLKADSINLMKYNDLPSTIELYAKIRYRDPGKPAKCYISNDLLYVEFIEPRRAITPGQSVVMYEGSDLVGGGIII